MNEIQQTRRVLAHVQRAHGLAFSLSGRAASGLQGGAWMVADIDGRPAVLKWSPELGPERIGQLERTVARMRAAGYPTPAWLAAGVTAEGIGYYVQEFAPGEPSSPLTPEKTDLLVAVLERQTGLLPNDAVDCNSAVKWMATGDSAERSALREMDTPGVDLLHRYDMLLAGFDRVELPAGDMVHGDFNSCNILLRGGRVSAVIDIEAVGGGTRAIDYACLLREAYVEDYGSEVIARIRAGGAAAAGRGALALCAAATAFWIVPFKLRHEPHRIEEILARLHQMAADLSA